MAEIKSDKYSVYIAKDSFAQFDDFLKLNRQRFSKIFILVDENTIRYCYPILIEKVKQLETATTIKIDSGEENKTIETCKNIWVQLNESGADRKSLLINLGGGVITDMGGFCASTFKRGIAFINVPTTLLSQVDASIGGKLGVDLNHLKNEIGSFGYPEAVFLNSGFLSTLPERQTLSGVAEIIKHALIYDSDYWGKIKTTNFKSPQEVDKIIYTSVNIKNDIVLKDPKENSVRKTLNFGHTIGHAIESYFLQMPKDKQLLHGEAVAIGMICEAFLSSTLCTLSKSELKELTRFITSMYPFIDIPLVNYPQVINLMKYDKKNTDGLLQFSLLSGIGKCEINKVVTTDLIQQSLEFYSNQYKLVTN